MIFMRYLACMKTRLLIHPKANYALKEGMGHLYKINKLNII